MKLQIFVSFCFWPLIYGFGIDTTDELKYPLELVSKRTPYVVGGHDAPDGAAPYQCSIQESKAHLCGCSIISENWILTAAHCVHKSNAKTLEILVGTNDLTNGGTYYKVDRYATHERYFLIFNDIAVVRIQGKIEFNRHVQPIELFSGEVPDKEDVVLTGWGDLKWRGEHPKHLQMIKLKAMSLKSCRRTILLLVLHKSHMCTSGQRGYGSCLGDSGGPLVYSNKVIGVVNFGLPCARGLPDVYASVPYFYDWIKSHTD